MSKHLRQFLLLAVIEFVRMGIESEFAVFTVEDVGKNVPFPKGKRVTVAMLLEDE